MASKVIGGPEPRPAATKPSERRRERRARSARSSSTRPTTPTAPPSRTARRLCDASTRGASFLIDQRLDPGRVLHLAAPLPRRFRTFDEGTPSYFVYALVRHVEPVDERWRVGVMFFGKQPPKGFDAHPGALYFMPGD